LFAGAGDLANFAIDQGFPDENRNLTFHSQGPREFLRSVVDGARFSY
jgi:hypothetical protein